MEKIIEKNSKVLMHIKALHDVFTNEENFDELTRIDFERYQENLTGLSNELSALNYLDLLYRKNGRQMILSDFFEYVFLGRIFYSMINEEDRSHFIRAILHLVNLLMYYESITFSNELRLSVIEKLEEYVPEISDEEELNALKEFRGTIGFPGATANDELNNYFDTLLPKTAGGLWHELLSYIHLIRNDVGYIIPLLLNQKLIGFSDHIVPPDFLLIEKRNRNIYGVEIGGLKERQSNAFMLKTGIPTISLDTRNSRTDRCPICHRWISFCPYVIEKYSDLSLKISKSEVRCIEDCDKYSIDQIYNGECPYAKYSRGPTRIDLRGKHSYADKLHYHYQCVLSSLNEEMRLFLMNEKDPVALKTHFPYYQGLEALLSN